MLRALTLVYALVFASATHATPFINGSFETGNLAGWTVNATFPGSASARLVNNAFNGDRYEATQGAIFAELKGGLLDNPTMISQTVTGNIGDILSFDWAFLAMAGALRTDYFTFTVNGAPHLLADIATVDDFGNTNWTNFSMTLQSAVSTIVFECAADGTRASLCNLDNVERFRPDGNGDGPPPSVAEPNTLSLAALATAFLLVTRRRLSRTVT